MLWFSKRLKRYTKQHQSIVEKTFLGNTGMCTTWKVINFGVVFSGSKLGLGRKLGRNWGGGKLVFTSFSVYTCLTLNKENCGYATNERDERLLKDADNNLVDALTTRRPAENLEKTEWSSGWQHFLEINGSFFSNVIYIKLQESPTGGSWRLFQ